MKEFISLHTISLILGIILDQIVGDPHFMPHPIRAIGNLISLLEKKLLGDVKTQTVRDGKKEKSRGALLWFIVVISVAVVMAFLLFGTYAIHPYFGVLTETVFSCYILAARSLCRESMAVYKKLDAGDTEGARAAVSMIVGRDTAELDEEGITKAAVETVAENTSDGVIAPLIYLAVGGPVLGMIYKAVNTMDSMIGYHNDKYENFGAFAARADDVFNYLPSRISALLMIAGSFYLGLFSKEYNGANALKIWKRDRLNHKSPNSAQTESVCAGALGLKLGGTHMYRGVRVEKPTIGDELRKTKKEDIKLANDLMFAAEALAALIICAILIPVILI